MLCSDGVHDNLDPEYMGITPDQCNLDSSSWDDGMPSPWSLCLFVCLSVCLFVCLSVCLFGCLVDFWGFFF